ncbi:transposase [Thermodesulfobacteriota bacterium]
MPILTGDIAIRARELIREICKMMDIKIIIGYSSKDHVHLLLTVPPLISASDVMKRIKVKISCKLLIESRILAKTFMCIQYILHDTVKKYSLFTLRIPQPFAAGSFIPCLYQVRQTHARSYVLYSLNKINECLR